MKKMGIIIKNSQGKYLSSIAITWKSEIFVNPKDFLEMVWKLCL